MKNIFRYIFILTILFVLPVVGYADEENNFQYIDINPSINLSYKVSGSERTHDPNLYVNDETPINLELYKVATDGTETRIDFNSSTINWEWITNPDTNEKTFRISNKDENTYFDKGINYKIKYNANINISGSYKTITYENTYSYDEDKNSSNDGILINIVDNISPKIKIKKVLTQGTPDGLFKFNISGDGISRDVLVNTSNGVGEVTLNDLYLSINTEYIIKETEMPDTSYKFVSIESNPRNIMIDSSQENPNPNEEERSIGIKPNNDTLYSTIEITATNASKVEHIKEIKDNDDGTYQLSLDITGSANIESKTAKANILIVYDVSSSMESNLNSDYYIKIRNDGETGVAGSSSATYYTTSTGGNNNRIYWNNGEFRTTNSASGTIHTGPVYVRLRSRNDRADAAELIVHYFVEDLLAYNNLEGNNASDPNVQIALVKFNADSDKICFNSSGEVACNGNNYWTTEHSIANWFEYDTSHGTSNDRYATGTNWESGLNAAKEILGTADADPTYVIFITDGMPTERDSTGSITDPSGCTANNEYCASLKPARDIQTTNSTTLFGIFAFGSTGGWFGGNYLDDVIYYAHTGIQRTGTLTGTTNTDGYYTASNPDDLDAAIQDIFRTISKALGVGSVSVIDGTTNGVTVTSGALTDEGLLDIDESSYKYYLSMNANKASGTIPSNIRTIANANSYSFTDNGNGTVRRNGNNLNVYTIARKDLNANDEPIDYTIYAIDNKDGTITCIWVDPDNNNRFLTVDGEIEVITEEDTNKYMLKYRWTAANYMYNKAPPTAHLDTNKTILDDDNNEVPNPDYGAVKWDLSSLETLLDGVTYTIEFNVWPSQASLDLIADLKNDPSIYSTLSESVRKYLIPDGHGGYTLYTNTENARIIYQDSRDEEIEIPISYVNPSPVATDAAKIVVSKNWVNDLDERNDPVKLYLVRDNTVLYNTPILLTESVDWTDEVYMSAGSVSLEKENNQIIAIIRTDGYDYNFAESGYKWDLEYDQTIHPMLINGVLAILVETKDTVTVGNNDILFANNKVYIRINSKIYEVKLDQYTGTDISTSDIPNNSFLVVSNIEDDIVTKQLYFNINGVIYEVHDSALDAIIATNYRRSNLNLKKVVTGDDPNNTAFKFNLYVKSADGDDLYFSIQNDTGITGTTATGEEVTIKTVFGLEEKIDPNDSNSDLYTNAIPEGYKTLRSDNTHITNIEEVTIGDVTYLTYKYDGSDNKVLLISKKTEDGVTIYTYVDTLVSNDSHITELKEVTIDGITYLSYKYNGIENEVKVLGKTTEDGVTTYGYVNGYYYFASEANNIYVYLRNGDNLRITNLPINSEFRIEEANTPNFELTNSEVWYNSKTTEKLTEDILNNITISNDFKIINGSIYTYNRNFWTEYTNDYLKTHINGTKTWIDNNNADSTRPGSITVILSDGTNTETKTVSANDEWKYEFVKERYNANGEEIVYTIDESPVANYRKVIEEGSYDITNILLTNISGTKTWIDGDNENQTRPNNITVKLYKVTTDENDNEVKTQVGEAITVSRNDNWQYTFNEPKYDSEGNLIVYTVDEDPITTAKYRKEVNGYNITNTLLRDIPITKEWVDDNNKYNSRPESIFIKLLGNNNVVVFDNVSIVADQQGNWSYLFSDLPMYDNNNVFINYSIDEYNVTNYYKSINDFAITNTYISRLTDIIIRKVWVENGERTPNGVIVEVYDTERNTISAGSISLAATDKVNDISWSKTLSLPMYYYDEENYTLTEIVYGIRELSIIIGDNTKNLNGNSLNIYDSVITNRLKGIWTVSYSKAEDGTLIATNTWEGMPTTTLTFKKVVDVKIDGNGNVLSYIEKSGAIFRLFVYIGGDANHDAPIDFNNPSSYTGSWLAIGDSDGSSLVVFNNLYEGEYRLVEIIAPEGYMLPQGQWKVIVSKDINNELQISITTTNATTTPAIINNTISGDTSILIPNYEIPDIPSTGGIGIPDYKGHGLLLMIISIITLTISQLISRKKIENI